MKKVATARANTPRMTPIAMPAFAPADSPLLLLPLPLPPDDALPLGWVSGLLPNGQ